MRLSMQACSLRRCLLFVLFEGTDRADRSIEVCPVWATPWLAFSHFVKANRAMYPIATMCRVLEVSASGYYAWRARPPSARARADAVLTESIREFHTQARGTCGAPRIHAELKDDGWRLGQKCVPRLMKDAGLFGVSRRQWMRTTQRREGARPAPDLVPLCQDSCRL